MILSACDRCVLPLRHRVEMTFGFTDVRHGQRPRTRRAPRRVAARAGAADGDRAWLPGLYRAGDESLALPSRRSRALSGGPASRWDAGTSRWRAGVTLRRQLALGDRPPESPQSTPKRIRRAETLDVPARQRRKRGRLREVDTRQIGEVLAAIRAGPPSAHLRWRIRSPPPGSACRDVATPSW